ncbi:MAG: NPCBM/NEW2 domain-containing protein [Capsulimonadales bacterium]|nr:NPCBM/NEW2 domain-containing protein [Capsulimonadales bacterium]
MRSAYRFLVALLSVWLPTSVAAARQTRLSMQELALDGITQEWGEPHKGRSVDNNPLIIGGRLFGEGIGTHAASEWLIDLKGGALRFSAMVGVDDETNGQGSVTFEVWVDGKKAFDSGTMKGKQPAKSVEVDLTGAKRLRLVVTDAGDGINYDHADWADAAIALTSDAAARPETAVLPVEPSIPIRMAPDPPEPAIHGPRVVGTTPGRPFLFRIPTTGQRPLRFSATGLPDGVSLDPNTGILTGSVKERGTYRTEITARGPRGTATRRLTIVAGQGIALTPPLGWNSWNVWGTAVTAERVRQAIDAFERSGLADHGFAYVNIDDGWEAGRAPDGTILVNEKFGDMKALADYAHGKGLKLGIYSSPGPKTCAGYEGSFGHERQDALTYAAWGVDYLKYDWCSYGGIAPSGERGSHVWPYRLMQRAFRDAPRDMVFSLCQYGMSNVWEWGPFVGGNCWRTTGDITDTWSSMAGIGFSQDALAPFARPGHWNDPDMLVVGKLGWGPNLRPTRLKPNEQITHITLWSLLAAPLLIGCDLTQLDDFTRALLTNDDVLEVNQDPLGKPATRKSTKGQTEIWARPLFDGTIAVGVFNRGMEGIEVPIPWKVIGLSGRQPVRDLWQGKDLGDRTDGWTVRVPAHGALLFKVGRIIGER